MEMRLVSPLEDCNLGNKSVGAVSHQPSMCLELLMLYSLTVHVSLLSQSTLNCKQDRR
ncbi:hypothetical protein PanWU01x14_000330, partial [Parasponia andersonii]